MAFDALLRALGQEQQVLDRHARVGEFQLGDRGRVVAAQEARVALGVQSVRLARVCPRKFGQPLVCLLKAPGVVQLDHCLGLCDIDDLLSGDWRCQPQRSHEQAGASLHRTSSS